MCVVVEHCVAPSKLDKYTHTQVEHFAVVLPAVFSIMADPDSLVQERACYALDTFCEGMDRENILPFMPQVPLTCLICRPMCQIQSVH